MKVIAGSWLIALVLTDLTTARSSTMPAVWGKSSLTQVPASPCCLNSKREGAIGKRACPEVIVVMRCPWRIESGRSWS